ISVSKLAVGVAGGKQFAVGVVGIVDRANHGRAVAPFFLLDIVEKIVLEGAHAAVAVGHCDLVTDGIVLGNRGVADWIDFLDLAIVFVVDVARGVLIRISQGSQVTVFVVGEERLIALGV